MMSFIFYVILYLITSSIWFLFALGRKNKPGKWYDHIFAPGATLVVAIFGWLSNKIK